MQKLIVSSVFIVACMLVAPAVWADISEATFTPQGSEVYQPVPVSQVEVFVYKPDFKFKILGLIEARGMAGAGRGSLGSLLNQLDITTYLKAPPGEREDIALAIAALKTEAANVGANGVFIIESSQARVSQNSTERRIKAIAILRTE